MRGAHQLKAIEIRYAAFLLDDVACPAVGLAKITIARGDDAANELAVMRIVEETDRLPGDRARRAAAAIAGDDKNVGFVYGCARVR